MTFIEEIQQTLNELTPSYVGVDYLRELETSLFRPEDTPPWSTYGPLVAARRKISDRICFLEVGCELDLKWLKKVLQKEQ